MEVDRIGRVATVQGEVTVPGTVVVDTEAATAAVVDTEGDTEEEA